MKGKSLTLRLVCQATGAPVGDGYIIQDPNYVPQYAAFFLMLSEERIEQQRSFLTFFKLVESWGAALSAIVDMAAPLRANGGAAHPNPIELWRAYAEPF